MNPKIKRDGGGPKESPLRLRIPSFLTGESESASEAEEFESKFMNTETKGDKDLSAEVYEAMHQ
eukprot:9830062-Lingulodinium_polyedra.AAC.1